ncbi:MAG: ABC transporter substrate-binding protein [Clostridia bacterium]|nr:ABC transporter substrate-binding protein [Clostridia bacterium]
MRFKAFLALILALILSASLVACAPAAPSTDGTDTSGASSDGGQTFQGADVRVAALSGSTGLGMAKLMNDAQEKTTVNRYTFEVFDAPEVLLPEITSNKFDIAALPTNVAAKLYNVHNGEYQMLAVNTLGVLYLLEVGTQTVKSVADLSGKTVYTTGQGSTPEYALKYILEKNGVTDCEIVFETNADLVAAHGDEGALLMLPEPKVTAVKGKLGNVTVALDMTAEWNKVCDTPMVQGCVIVNKKFAQANPQAVQQFLTEYEASINYVKQNVADASELVAKFKIIPQAALAAKAIPNSNLTFLAGAEMKAALVPFYQVLHQANPSSVGGKLPETDFYYGT